jgi:hypothetical protein
VYRLGRWLTRTDNSKPVIPANDRPNVIVDAPIDGRGTL